MTHNRGEAVGSFEVAPPESDAGEIDHAQKLGDILIPHITQYAERSGLTINEAAQASLRGIARNMEASEYMKPSEVAALFGVSPKTIARQGDQGLLPGMVVTLGGHRRFPREAVMDALAAGFYDTTSPETSEDS
jgi:excisionase family DNA binding protein